MKPIKFLKTLPALFFIATLKKSAIFNTKVKYKLVLCIPCAAASLRSLREMYWAVL